jgi:hypothetical protein
MQPVQYFPNKSSSRSPWASGGQGGGGGGAPSVISSEDSTTAAQPPPSIGGTNEYRSEAASTVPSSSAWGSELSSLRRSPQQQAQNPPNLTPGGGSSGAHAVDIIQDLENEMSVVPFRAVSPHHRGSPLPGFSALGGIPGGATGTAQPRRGGSPQRTASIGGLFPAHILNSTGPGGDRGGGDTDRDASTATINAFQLRRGGSPARRGGGSPSHKRLVAQLGLNTDTTVDVLDVSDKSLPNP